MLSAIVLAAGSSERMGDQNKLLLPYKNKTVIEHVVGSIYEAGLEEIIVVVGHESEKIKEVLKNLPVHFVYNQDYTEGMTTSIQKGILHANGNGYMICLADMVLIRAEEYALLKNSFEKQVAENPKCICLPRFKNEKGNPVIFSTFYRDDILQHKEREGCKEIVKSNKENIFWVDMDTQHILQDMDYPEDYNKISSDGEPL
jgi:molybdenum cofactor cytidylyltransferase